MVNVFNTTGKSNMRYKSEIRHWVPQKLFFGGIQRQTLFLFYGIIFVQPTFKELRPSVTRVADNANNSDK
ncbi:predicted protein [Sclerotinia sclerotiorum 1980 UF-70]|uniref:Uncharacterized protein n=1 Tax=Sclerotinia sclerotiorum (strain ATCC 18683 / 1980 / Ss-1) TaxID=665079 RepID=A7EM19_SCLS1|nr:predicted protein [Sclerotinia sclerotiorum 1980 UF-70]EDO03885.1 predicted protein [Sclerotinia sclerotiorum 1980 UF-70]